MQEQGKKIEKAIEELGLSVEDREKAMQLGKFMIRIASLDVSKIPVGHRAGDTLCGSGC